MMDKVKRILGLATRKTGNKLVISVEKLERRVALLENGRLEEYNVERNTSTSDGTRLTDVQREKLRSHHWERNFYRPD